MSLGDLRVLVVDDEADVRLGLQLLIEGLGAEVRTVSSGEEALEALEMWLPHVMLSDITMGGITGMELLAETRRRWPTVRVLMITGYGTIELAVEALRNGAVHFLTKPFDNEEILAEVDRHGREALVAEQVRRMIPAGDAEPLVLRPKNAFDGALPAASSVALEVYSRLFLLTGDVRWQKLASLNRTGSDLEREETPYRVSAVS